MLTMQGSRGDGRSTARVMLVPMGDGAREARLFSVAVPLATTLDSGVYADARASQTNETRVPVVPDGQNGWLAEDGENRRIVRVPGMGAELTVRGMPRGGGVWVSDERVEGRWDDPTAETYWTVPVRRPGTVPITVKDSRGHTRVARVTVESGQAVEIEWARMAAGPEGNDGRFVAPVVMPFLNPGVSQGQGQGQNQQRETLLRVVLFPAYGSIFVNNGRIPDADGRWTDTTTTVRLVRVSPGSNLLVRVVESGPSGESRTATVSVAEGQTVDLDWRTMQREAVDTNPGTGSGNDGGQGQAATSATVRVSGAWVGTRVTLTLASGESRTVNAPGTPLTADFTNVPAGTHRLRSEAPSGEEREGSVIVPATGSVTLLLTDLRVARGVPVGTGSERGVVVSGVPSRAWVTVLLQTDGVEMLRQVQAPTANDLGTTVAIPAEMGNAIVDVFVPPPGAEVNAEGLRTAVAQGMGTRRRGHAYVDRASGRGEVRFSDMAVAVVPTLPEARAGRSVELVLESLPPAMVSIGGGGQSRIFQSTPGLPMVLDLAAGEYLIDVDTGTERRTERRTFAPGGRIVRAWGDLTPVARNAPVQDMVPYTTTQLTQPPTTVLPAPTGLSTGATVAIVAALAAAAGGAAWWWSKKKDAEANETPRDNPSYGGGACCASCARAGR
ncbi:MAG: hypothetical protein JNK72_24610 [Myxococcales bacterium]|nr:hypothetical protein [Myxococcales bacterium]